MTTQSYCAKLMGISERRFRELRDEGVLPRTGKYDPEVLLPIYCAHLRELAVRNKGTASQSTDEARLQKARADKAEIEAAEMRNELIPASQVADAVHGAVIIMKTRLNAIPAKAAPLAHSAPSVAVAERHIREQIDEALDALGRVKVLGL